MGIVNKNIARSKRTTIVIPNDLYKSMKLYCINNDLSQVEFITQSIINYLKDKQK